MDAIPTRTGGGPGLDGRAADRPSTAVLLVGACTLAAGVVHAAAVISHSGDAVAAWLFALAAAGQLGAGAWLLFRPAGRTGRVALASAVGINAVALGAWLLSRTVGLPPFTAWGTPDVAGVQDGAAAILAVFALLAAGSLLVVHRPLPAAVVPLAMVVAAIPMVVGVTADHGHSDHGTDLVAHEHAAAEGSHQGPDHADSTLAHVGSDHDEGHDSTGEVAAHAEGTHDAGPDVAGHSLDHGVSAGPAHEDHAEDPAPGNDHGAHAEHPGGSTTVGGGGHAHPPTPPTTGLASDPIFAGASTAGLTESQLAAAKDLIVRTRAVVASRFATTAAAEAAGYTSIGDGRQVGGFEHYVNFGFIDDPNILNPSLVESLVYRNDGGGRKTLVSAMFILPFGRTMASVPDIAGSLTSWHDHQNLCWDGTRLAGTLQNGVCVNGVFRATPPMLHVWLVAHPCGPFAGVESHGSCAHAH
jgi:hypothetical protein